MANTPPNTTTPVNPNLANLVQFAPGQGLSQTAPTYAFNQGGTWRQTTAQDISALGIDPNSLTTDTRNLPSNGSTPSNFFNSSIVGNINSAGIQSYDASQQQTQNALATPPSTQVGPMTPPQVGPIGGGAPLPGQAFTGPGSGGASGQLGSGPTTTSGTPATPPGTVQAAALPQTTLPAWAQNLSAADLANPAVQASLQQAGYTVAQVQQSQAANQASANGGTGGVSNTPATPPPAGGTPPTPATVGISSTPSNPNGTPLNPSTATPLQPGTTTYNGTGQANTPATPQNPNAPVPNQDSGMARNLSAEQAFVKNWQGQGGKLPTAAQINQAVYGTPNPSFNTPQGIPSGSGGSGGGAGASGGGAGGTGASGAPITPPSTDIYGTEEAAIQQAANDTATKVDALQAQIDAYQNNLNTSLTSISGNHDMSESAQEGEKALKTQQTNNIITNLQNQLSDVQAQGAAQRQAAQDILSTEEAKRAAAVPFGIPIGQNVYQVDPTTGKATQIATGSTTYQQNETARAVQAFPELFAGMSQADIQALSLSDLANLLGPTKEAQLQNSLTGSQYQYTNTQGVTTTGQRKPTITPPGPGAIAGKPNTPPGTSAAAPTQPLTAAAKFGLDQAAMRGTPTDIANVEYAMKTQGYVPPPGSKIPAQGAAPKPTSSGAPALRGPVAAKSSISPGSAIKTGTPASAYSAADVNKAALAVMPSLTPYDQAIASYDSDLAKYGLSGTPTQRDLTGLKGIQSLDTTLKPLQTTLGHQAIYLGQVKTSFQNFDQGFKQLTDAFAGKVNLNDPQILNTSANNLSKLATSGVDIRAFNAGLTEVRTEYNQVVARGGSADDQTRSIAAGALPADVSIGTLLKIKDELAAQGTIVINNQTQLVQDTKNQINDSLSSGLTSSSATGTAGSYTSSSGKTYNLPY